MTHDDLARSLANHLRGDRRMVWCDLQLGAAGSVRPDVYAIYKSYSNPAPTAYEVKISVSDFRADVTAGKWQSYLRYAGAVYFACEAGLVRAADVPVHCGLMVFTPSAEGGRWRAAKKAVLSPVTIPQDALLKLIIDGVEREGPSYRRKHWSNYVAEDTSKKLFGALVGAAVRDRLTFEAETDYARHSATLIEQNAHVNAKRIVDEAKQSIEPLRAELCGALGLPSTAHIYDIERAVNRLSAAIREHPAQTQLKTFVYQLRHVLAQAEQVCVQEEGVPA